jgi:hypothetical protein
MSTESAIARIIAEPRPITGPGPSHSSLRGLSRTILRDILRELKRRQLLGSGCPEMTSAEEKAAMICIRVYAAAVDEAALEAITPPISLAELTDAALTQLLAPPSTQ